MNSTVCFTFCQCVSVSVCQCVSVPVCQCSHYLNEPSRLGKIVEYILFAQYSFPSMLSNRVHPHYLPIVSLAQGARLIYNKDTFQVADSV